MFYIFCDASVCKLNIMSENIIIKYLLHLAVSDKYNILYPGRIEQKVYILICKKIC